MNVEKQKAWLWEKKQQQDALPKYANPVLLSRDLKRKAETLDRFCKPIMTKLRPPPAKPQPFPTETPPAQPQTAEQQQVTDGSSPTPPTTASEPMDTDKSV
uniref:Uncharacterized protein n=1 Tax=Musa acuminata subsp. malaccensis TaxID=214687 RepID=A0A804JTN5_MUSAM